MKKIFPLIAAVSLAFVLQACVKETKVIEKRLVPQRQAKPDLNQSMSLGSGNVLTIKKEALGKAFLLLPNARTSGRTPQWSDFKPLIVSFEKSGTKLGLFKLTTDNLYADIPADNLMQTFNILNENSETLDFDWSSGINSIALNSNFEILIRKELDDKMQKDGSGVESALEIKNSFIRKIEMKNDRLSIDQISRISMEDIKESEDPEDPTRKSSSIEKNETTVTFRFELRPYKESTTFKPSLFDKDQRIGSFISFLNEPGQDYPTPLAMKWDISPEAGPISLVIAKNTPKEIAQSISEAGEYWNKAFGRTVFVPKIAGTSGDLPAEREMIVRWINWESAGFAYASAQADPLTGEILRAQVFLTSSWYLYAKSLIPKVGEPDIFGVDLNKTGKSALNSTGFLTRKTALCVMSQSEVYQQFGLMGAKEDLREKVSLDVIRTVVAHEMGHAIGMRHNFTGTIATTETDLNLIKASADYVKDINHKGIAFSSSVMDYTQMVGTALNGAYILHDVLPYDQQFTDSIYFGQEIKAEKYNYCSDEHIMMANAAGKSIYGCDRFDSFKNPFLGELYSIKDARDHIVARRWARMISTYSKPNPYEPIETPDSSVGQQLYGLYPILFVAKDRKFDPLLSIKSAVDSTVKNELQEERETLKDKLTADFTELGGWNGVLSWVVPSAGEGQTPFQNQAERLFAEVKASDYPFLSEEKFNELKASLLQSAAEADANLVRSTLAQILPINDLSFMFPELAKEKTAAEGEAPKAMQFEYRPQFDMSADDLKAMFKLVRENFITRGELKSATVYGKEIKVSFENVSINNFYKFMLVNYADSKYYPSNLRAEESIFTEEKALLVRELAKSTIAVLEAAQLLPNEITKESLLAATEQLDEKQMIGVTKTELQTELLNLYMLP